MNTTKILSVLKHLIRAGTVTTAVSGIIGTTLLSNENSTIFKIAALLGTVIIAGALISVGIILIRSRVNKRKDSLNTETDD